MERCKTCGREFSANQTMTYSVYGYCSWECLMNKRGLYTSITKEPKEVQHTQKSRTEQIQVGLIRFVGQSRH